MCNLQPAEEIPQVFFTTVVFKVFCLGDHALAKWPVKPPNHIVQIETSLSLFQ